MSLNFTGMSIYPSPAGYIEPTYSLGVGIELWGAVGQNNSAFTVTVDNSIVQTLPSNTRVPPLANNSQLLFFNHNLTDGNHTLTVMNNPAWSNQIGAPTTLDIDYTLSFARDAASVPSPLSPSPMPQNSKE